MRQRRDGVVGEAAGVAEERRATVVVLVGRLGRCDDKHWRGVPRDVVARLLILGRRVHRVRRLIVEASVKGADPSESCSKLDEGRAFKRVDGEDVKQEVAEGG